MNKERAIFSRVKLDGKLSWHSHGDFMAGKLNKAIFLLRNLAIRITADMLRTFYFRLLHLCVL